MEEFQGPGRAQGQGIMGTFESNAQAFVLRIWREPREIEGAPAVYRLALSHVASGALAYFQEVDELCTFIKLYLQGRAPRPHGEPTESTREESDPCQKASSGL